MLQTSMYDEELVEELVNVLFCIARHNFTADASIKPLISYLAAGLEPGGKSRSVEGELQTHPMKILDEAEPPTPLSRPATPLGQSDLCARAERVLDGLLTLLKTESYMVKFKASVPVARVCTLLLGVQPRPSTLGKVLHLVSMILRDDPE